ncbi:MAG: hypothetical protein M0Q88_05950 [Bacilli bacterium]|nr:hypothetical protein [Bacilli bacterium]
MIKYAQKNGGFVVDDSGRDPSVLFTDLLKTYDIEENIVEVIFTKPLGEKVNKKDKLSISITPRISIIVPFNDPIVREGSPMVEYGYSHKFFK